MNILDTMYYKYNKKAVDEGRKYVKKISVKKFIDWYIKSLTEKHDDFKIITQNSEYADIISWKGNTKYLFRYHRCQMVFSEQFESFITLVEMNNVNKAFYITCGVFEEDIRRNRKANAIFKDYKLYILDDFHLIRRILGLSHVWKNKIENFEIFDSYSP